MSDQEAAPKELAALIEVLAEEYGPWFGGPEMRPTPGALRAAERAAWALVDAGLVIVEEPTDQNEE